MRRMPLRPSRSACQKLETSCPRAEMAPSPVMATRRIGSGGGAGAAGGERAHAVNHLAHAADGARLLVGNGNVERALHLEQNVHAVERINPQLLEGAVRGDALGGEALDGRDDRDDFFFQRIGHGVAARLSQAAATCASRGFQLAARSAGASVRRRLAMAYFSSSMPAPVTAEMAWNSSRCFFAYWRSAASLGGSVGLEDFFGARLASCADEGVRATRALLGFDCFASSAVGISPCAASI